jgi:ATP-dependent DNA helicase RecQ
VIDDVEDIDEDDEATVQSVETVELFRRIKHTSTGSLLLKTLQDTFGHTSFRHGQVEVIQALLDKSDVAVFWPTGQGKSLCYQIPSLHLNQVVVVVSPLISLMQDQVCNLNSLSDVPVAAFLGSA